MYAKYLIFSCISAFLIIVSKYLYQKWIQHVVQTKNTSVQLFSLEKRVDALEKQIKEQNNSLSGGVQIPITFKPLQPAATTKKTTFVDEPVINNTEPEVSIGEVIEQATEPNTTEQPTLEMMPVTEEPSIVDTEKQTKPKKSKKEKIATESSNETNSESDSKPKKESKKSKKNPTANAKDFANGDKITEDGVEWICIVGKNGGHSWKRIESSNTMIIDSVIAESLVAM